MDAEDAVVGGSSIIFSSHLQVDVNRQEMKKPVVAVARKVPLLCNMERIQIIVHGTGTLI